MTQDPNPPQAHWGGRDLGGAGGSPLPESRPQARGLFARFSDPQAARKAWEDFMQDRQRSWTLDLGMAP